MNNRDFTDKREKFEKLEKKQKDFTEIRVITKNAKFDFIGKHRMDLEKPNWHYYETEHGNILHFKKQYMVCVIDNYTNYDVNYDIEYH